MRHVLIDQHTFPREKVCGDAFSGKAVEQLRKVDPRTADLLFRKAVVYPVSSMLLVSPWGDAFRLTFREGVNAPLNGFVAPRRDYDNILFEQIAAAACVTHLPSVRITDYRRTSDGQWRLFSRDDEVLRARLVLIADGARSAFVRKVLKRPPVSSLGAVRSYYSGVSFPDRRAIELHFLKELTPGYFWIFPMARGMANVGVGRATTPGRPSPPLRNVFESLRKKAFSARFGEAMPQGPLRGWPIPLHSRWWDLVGDGYMVLGDAAELVDPFTGEGIGNAMLSGRLAAEKVVAAKGHYGRTSLGGYVTALRRQTEGEFQVSRFLQRMAARPSLFSWLLRRLSRSPYARRRVSEMLIDTEARKDLVNPIFYLRALFSF